MKHLLKGGGGKLVDKGGLDDFKREPSLFLNSAKKLLSNKRENVE